jgi:hypothetical protein
MIKGELLPSLDVMISRFPLLFFTLYEGSVVILKNLFILFSNQTIC